MLLPDDRPNATSCLLTTAMTRLKLKTELTEHFANFLCLATNLIPTLIFPLRHPQSQRSIPVDHTMSNPEPHTQWPSISPLVNFPSPTSVSKIIQHSRADLLLAMLHPPEIRRLAVNTRTTRKDPWNHRAWQTLYRFGDGVKSCHGMTRLDRWRYAVITSEDEMTTLSKPYRIELDLKKGRCAIWIVDLKRWGTGNGWVEVRKLVDAPYAGCLRGITALPVSHNEAPLSFHNTRELERLPYLLVSDATQGKIYILDANDGQGAV